MGYAGLDLFKDLDVPEAVAYRIKSSREWNPDDCRRLCELADMVDEYDSADSDTVEDVVSAAADKLGVEIFERRQPHELQQVINFKTRTDF